MHDFKAKLSSVVEDCVVAIISTVIVNTSVQVIQGIINGWLYEDDEEQDEEEQEGGITLEELATVIKEQLIAESEEE